MTRSSLADIHEKTRVGSEAALALLQALMMGNEASKKAAYQRLQLVWTQTEIDDLTLRVESLFRTCAG
ncbi:MAG: hypothetical protein HOH43_13625 [Candidatus Latescibacteria bacterium]|nr:hypothetical protein [Candidatus Latescibacterota bacterium]